MLHPIQYGKSSQQYLQAIVFENGTCHVFNAYTTSQNYQKKNDVVLKMLMNSY